MREDQIDLVASVTKSLADAYVYDAAIFRLAYVGNQIVGYLTLYPYTEDDKNYVNVVRLMIDQHHQGSGHGRALLRAGIDHARSMRPKVNLVRISTLPHNEPALALYRSEGFIESGIEENEIALYLDLSSVKPNAV